MILYNDPVCPVCRKPIISYVEAVETTTGTKMKTVGFTRSCGCAAAEGEVRRLESNLAP